MGFTYFREILCVAINREGPHTKERPRRRQEMEMRKTRVVKTVYK